MGRLRNGENPSFIFFEDLTDEAGRVGYIRDPEMAKLIVAAYNSVASNEIFAPPPRLVAPTPAVSVVDRKGNRTEHIWEEKYLDAFKRTYEICEVCGSFKRDGAVDVGCRGPRRVVPRTSTGKKLPA